MGPFLRLFLLFINTFCFGFSVAVDSYLPTRRDPRVYAIAKPIYQKLVKIGAKDMVPLSKIQFLTAKAFPVSESDKKRGVLVEGVCAPGLHGKPEVIIRESLLNTASDLFLEQLVLHELGHCALGRDHLEGKKPNSSAPKSVMGEVMMDDDTFFVNRDYYYQELAK